MTLDFYTFLIFLHVLLFAYWLGPDWGVFVCARRVANEELPRDERLHFLTASVAVDILPRSSIALIIAVGFTLGYLGGYVSMTSFDLWSWWVMTGIWLGLIWTTGYLLKPGALKTMLDRVHVWLRTIVTAFIAALGILSFFMAWPIADMWLATKLTLIAVLLIGGSVLRNIVGSWMAELTAPDGSESHAATQGTIARTYPITRRLVYLFWGTTITIAFLGVTKPF